MKKVRKRVSFKTTTHTAVPPHEGQKKKKEKGEMFTSQNGRICQSKKATKGKNW